jgi:UDP-N-acetylglucosamine enolpyruvyl transferase
MFDNGLAQAGIDISFDDKGYKWFKKIRMPKKNIMMQEFSVTAIEALITYLAFLPDVNYEIVIRQAATEPHVKNLIKFLNNAGAQIQM